MSLKGDIKFQKALALAASASNQFEAEAAELAARRLMETYQIDPTDIPNGSLYSRINFADNLLLAKLRNEWREQHPPVLPPPRSSPQIKPSSDPEGSLIIPFSINGYRKHAQKRYNKRPPQKRATVKITPEMLKEIHAMLRNGIEPCEIRRKFGLTEGQIAGRKQRWDKKQKPHSAASFTGST